MDRVLFHPVLVSVPHLRNLRTLEATDDFSKSELRDGFQLQYDSSTECHRVPPLLPLLGGFDIGSDLCCLFGDRSSGVIHYGLTGHEVLGSLHQDAICAVTCEPAHPEEVRVLSAGRDGIDVASGRDAEAGGLWQHVPRVSAVDGAEELAECGRPERSADVADAVP